MGTVKDHLKRRDAMRVQKLFEKFDTQRQYEKKKTTENLHT